MFGATFSGGSLFILLYIEGLETMLPVVNQRDGEPDSVLGHYR